MFLWGNKRNLSSSKIFVDEKKLILNRVLDQSSGFTVTALKDHFAQLSHSHLTSTDQGDMEGNRHE